jgi:tetratricopeptide (TPR) repeat protein
VTVLEDNESHNEDNESHDPFEPARQLPPDVENFEGREEDFATLLRSRTPPPGHKLAPAVLILGEAGIGKSALAIHLAHSLTSRYPGHQLYCNFQHHAPPLVPLSPAQVLRGFLVAMHVSPHKIPESLEKLAEMFRQMVQRDELLVLLDNVAPESRVELFLPPEHISQIIVTSRQQLHIDHTPHHRLRSLTDDGARRLFAKVSKVSENEIPEEHQATIGQLVRECNGRPLAVRVLAARVRVDGTQNAAAMLGRIQALRQASAPAEGTTSQLPPVLSYCYERLDPDEALLFRRLSVVPGASFERSLAGHLAEVMPLVAGVTLKRLLRSEFVQPTLDPSYFELHSTMRELGSTRLQSDEGEASLGRHIVRALDFYLVHAKAWDRVLQPHSTDARHGTVQAEATPRQRREALAWMSAERLNLVAAVRKAAGGECPFTGNSDLQRCKIVCTETSLCKPVTCSDGEPPLNGHAGTFLGDNTERAWRLCRAMAGYFEIQSDWVNWEQTHRDAMRALDSLGDTCGGRGRAHVLRGLGRLQRALRQWPEAINSYREAIALFKEHDENEFVGMTLLSLGDVYRYTRSWDAAVNCLEESCRILEDEGYHRGLAIALRSIGAVHRLRGDFDEAMEVYDHAREILEAVGDERWQAATELSLYDVRLDQGDNSQREPLVKCLEVFERMGDQHWRALTLRSLGEACRLSRNYAAALSYLGQSARAMEESGDELWRAQVTHCIGLVHLDIGQLEIALTSFKKSLKVFVDEGDTLWQGRTHASMARAHRALASGASTEELGSVHLREAWRAVCRAWPLLVEQGAKHDLQGLN